MKLSTVTLWLNKLLNWLTRWGHCQMKLLISKRKELGEVGPQAQHIIFNNLRMLIFHPLHFPSKALFTLTRWDHARHQFCVQAVDGWRLCVERRSTDVFTHLSIEILFHLSWKSLDVFLRGVWMSEAILGHFYSTACDTQTHLHHSHCGFELITWQHTSVLCRRKCTVCTNVLLNHFYQPTNHYDLWSLLRE